MKIIYVNGPYHGFRRHFELLKLIAHGEDQISIK